MFKNLSTGTKLFILCGVFFVAIAIPIYSLIIEKKASIDFTRKELVGSRYLAVLRGTYAAILNTELSSSDPPEIPQTSFDEVLTRLGAAETAAGGITQTADLERSLSATLHELWFARDARTPIDTFVVAALTTAHDLTTRIADDSNLAIDPNLESYYLQDVVVRKLPAVMDEIGEAQLILRETAALGALSSEHKERLLMLDGLLRSTVLEMRRDLAAAYRADADGSLKRVLDTYITETTRFTGLYLNAMSVRLLAGSATNIDSSYFAKLYKSAVQSGLNTWTAAHAELDSNLDHRVAELLADMRGSLLLTGLLALASILVAIIVHRGIVPPLKELARLAGEISATKNYDLRVKALGTDEIGQLGRSFNDMLSELATARHRESAAQLELARVARLTAAGEMSASIAHEIKQPLAAVVANGSAGLRWLRKVPPDLSEVEEVLKQIVSEGNRASEVIGSVQSMFKGDDQARAPVNVNAVIRQTFTLVQGELRSKGIISRLELLNDLPRVLGSRVQLQQVILNLIMNAVEALGTVTDHARTLQVTSTLNQAGDVSLTVNDSGPGIDPAVVERIFDPFLTTKPQGMGMGLSICRTIIEGHGGRIWASPGDPQGSIFHIVLPALEPDNVTGGLTHDYDTLHPQ